VVKICIKVRFSFLLLPYYSLLIPPPCFYSSLFDKNDPAEPIMAAPGLWGRVFRLRWLPPQ